MAIELTRDELFKQVWERPMTKVAADYCISDVALRKVCIKHRIPVPGRGYWAKKAAGKNVKCALFRAVTDPYINRIVIYRSPAPYLLEAVQMAKDAAKKRERSPENKIKAIAEPLNLHSRVAKTKKKLKQAKPSKTGLVATSGPEFFELEVGPESVERVITFLNAFVTAAEARQYRATTGILAQVFVVDNVPLNFKIAEKITRTKHDPTQAELAAIEMWEKRQQRRSNSWARGNWTQRPTPPEWDYVPNGSLQIIVNEELRYGYSGLRRSFGDGKTQRIETLINAIFEAFATWSAAIKAKRIEDKRRERERKEKESRREEQQRRNALDCKRVEALSMDLDQRHQRRQILAYIAAVTAKLNTGNYEGPEEVREWIAWAKGYADRIDPLSDGMPRLLQFEDFDPWELRY